MGILEYSVTDGVLLAWERQLQSVGLCSEKAV